MIWKDLELKYITSECQELENKNSEGLTKFEVGIHNKFYILREYNMKVLGSKFMILEFCFLIFVLFKWPIQGWWGISKSWIYCKESSFKNKVAMRIEILLIGSS